MADYVPDLTCIVRKEPEHRPFDWLRGGPKFGVSTVICGRATVEQYLRCGYVFDWPATDSARAQGTSGSAQDAQRLDPQGAGPVRQDAPDTPDLSTPLPSGSIER